MSAPANPNWSVRASTTTRPAPHSSATGNRNAAATHTPNWSMSARTQNDVAAARALLDPITNLTAMRIAEAPLMRPDTPAACLDVPPPAREAKWESSGFPRAWPPARWLKWRLPEYTCERGYHYYIPTVEYAENVESMLQPFKGQRVLWIYKPRFVYGRTNGPMGPQKTDEQPQPGCVVTVQPNFYRADERSRVRRAFVGPQQRFRVDESWVPVNQPVGALVITDL